MTDRSTSSDRPGAKADRGTLWTIEALLFLTLVLGGLVLAATVLPSNDAPETYTDAQRSELTNDVLRTGSATGAVRNTSLYWNAQQQRFVDAPRTAPSSVSYTTLSSVPDHPLWPPVNLSLRQNQLAYNIEIDYQNSSSSGTQTQQVVIQGPPGRSATSGTVSFTLSDDAQPEIASTSTDGDPCTLGEMGGNTTAGTNGCTGDAFFAPDAYPSGNRYNVLTIKITVWNQ